MESYDRPGSKSRQVEDLANDLMLAQETRPDPSDAQPHLRGDIAETTGHRGRAIFLVGAGCSWSAKIPLAADIARRAVQILWQRYLSTASEETDIPNEQEALAQLIRAGKLPQKFQNADGSGEWEALYPYLFSEHIKHPNHQRELISSMVGRTGALNWAHACLGELVSRRYIHTVLTTNFDQLVLQGIIRTGEIPVVADGMESLSRIDPSPSTPQVVHLHGSMHTYDLRNSPRAITETRTDDRLKATMQGLLRQSTLFVIVGYRGGEEGVMDLIQNAAENFKRMVIYWIGHENDYRSLSARAKRLIQTGENTFFIINQDADTFFQSLLRDTKIGQPAWVEDPIQPLVQQSGELESVPDNQEIGALVGDYRGRIQHAHKNRPPKDDALLKALKARSRGDFSEAIEILSPLANGDNYRARRLLAQSYRDRSNDDDAAAGGDIEQSIELFRGLIDEENNVQKFNDIRSYVDTTWDLHDRTAKSPLSDGDVQRLEGIRETISRDWKEEGFTEKELAQLVLDEARVFQELSEKAKQGSDPTMRQTVITTYRAAAEALKGESSDLSRDAEEGLAGALVADAEIRIKNDGPVDESAIAEMRSNLNYAIQVHVALTEYAWFNSSSRGWAGSASNLATAYLQLAAIESLSSDVGRQNALRDAATALRNAIQGYAEDGDEGASAQESIRLAEVEQELAE